MIMRELWLSSHVFSNNISVCMYIHSGMLVCMCLRIHIVGWILAIKCPSDQLRNWNIEPIIGTAGSTYKLVCKLGYQVANSNVQVTADCTPTGKWKVNTACQGRVFIFKPPESSIAQAHEGLTNPWSAFPMYVIHRETKLLLGNASLRDHCTRH